MEEKVENTKESKLNTTEVQERTDHQKKSNQGLIKDSDANPLLSGTSKEVDFALELFEGIKLRKREENVPKKGRGL